MSRVSRRIFLTVGGAAAITPPSLEAASAAKAPQGPSSSARGARDAAGSHPYLFFSAAEAAFIEPAVDRLIPPGGTGPGAIEAGVPQYIDLQLAGAWGAGERLYRGGPWQKGVATQGYQLPFTPAQLYRNALRGIANDLKQQGKDFRQLDGPAQDAYLTQLQNGQQELEGVPADVFFESLLALAIEGYFSDPAYGGNRDMLSWRAIGFPGAYGNYYELVDQHGVAFNVPPRSLAEDGRGHVHVMPVARGRTRERSR